MLESEIIGQRRLITEANAIIEALNEGKNLNLLFTGRSGIGKSHFVTAMANDIGLQNFIAYSNPREFTFRENKRFQVFDEAHEISTPEILYPYMDSKKYTFFIMTNFYGDLLEPFRNRCIHLTFDSYSIDEIAEIIYRHIDIEKEASLYLATFSKGSPRLAKHLAKRMFILKGTRVLKEDIDPLLKKLGINPEGLNQDDRIYLEALNMAKGRASLNLLCKLTGFDSGYITEIETHLIKEGKIMITGRGRVLC